MAGPKRGRLDGWRGIVLIASTYVYFLIFAQFGFLKRLDALGIAGTHLRLVMAAMATGGIFASLSSPRLLMGIVPLQRLRYALLGCGAAALLTIMPLTLATGIAVSLLLGLSLGLLTVTLVSNLDLWMGERSQLLKVGLGTGLGYFLCNVPSLFNASPTHIAVSAAAVCALGAAVSYAGKAVESHDDGLRGAAAAPQCRLTLAWFAALVWLDSAAFFIIQNSPALKSGTWGGPGHLWRNAILHLGGALGSAWMIRRQGLSTTLTFAFVLLAGACLLLRHPENAGAASLLYPAGVSLYSVALVAYPSFLMRASSRPLRESRAGWIYALAGWVASAMGIGMAQNLHRVPASFVFAAAVLFVAPWAWRLRKTFLPQIIAAVVLLALAQLMSSGHQKSMPNTMTPIERGRQVYISEGCINCHSQYVRPHSTDVELWGPTRDLESIRQEKPPLIGNRRQGPDLSEVGSRRSSLWLRMHFMNPRDVSYDSIMPSYAYLFQDERGEALLAYVGNLKTPDSSSHLQRIVATWSPRQVRVAAHNDAAGQQLFNEYCSTCHIAGGKARTKWGYAFRRIPPNLAVGNLIRVPRNESLAAREARIAKIVKFGIPGTDMPGHEYLPDWQVETIAEWVARMRAPEPD